MQPQAFQAGSISDAWSLPVLLPRQVGAGGALGLLNTESHNTTSIFIFLSIRCHFKLNISFVRLSSQTKLGRQNTSIDEVTISFLLTHTDYRVAGLSCPEVALSK